MATKPVQWNGTDAQGKPLRWGTPGLVWNGTMELNPEPTKRMQHIRVNLGFATAPDHSIEETAGAVITNLYGNALYPSPPVTKAALQAALTAFTDAIAAQAQGGTAATAEKNSKRDTLVGMLRQLAGYVQENCGNSLANLLTSGFDAVSTNRAQTALAAPSIRDILNGNSGQLILRITPVVNSRCYEARYAPIGANGAPGPWQGGGLHTDSRSMPVNGLTPGTNYTFQVRAVGGSEGYSDWSDPMSHMSL